MTVALPQRRYKPYRLCSRDGGCGSINRCGQIPRSVVIPPRAGDLDPGAKGTMRTKLVRVFSIALVLGWSAPNPTQPHLGLAVEARDKSHVHKTVKKRYRTVRKGAVQKRVGSRAVIKPSAPRVRLATADQQPPSSSAPPSLDVPMPPVPSTLISPPPELQVPTPDEQMEKLRLGLEKLARTYPSREAHMEKLRLGLERLATRMNSSRP